MTVKVLVNSIDQNIIAGVRQVTNTETEEVVAYWVREPRLISYVADPENEGQISIRFVPLCIASDESEYSIRAESIVSILEPKAAIAESYRNHAFPEAEETVTPEVVVEEEEAAE